VPVRFAAAATLLATLALPASARPEGPSPAGQPPGWPWTFPIWGQAATERGAELPLPLGFSVVGNWQRDDITISDVNLGIGRTPALLSFRNALEFGRVRNDAYAVLGRVDLWVLPMINAYALGGPIWTRTQVHLRQPLDLHIASDAHGWNAGFGGTAAAANRWGFVSLDANVTWTWLDILSRPQVAFMVDPRVGRRFRPLDGVALSAWVGGTYQIMVNRSVGSVPLGGTIDPSVLGTSIIGSPWYNAQPPDIQQNMQQLTVQAAGAVNDPQARLYYDVQVKPVEPWSMNAGFQAELGRRWFAMGEATFFGSRRGLLLSGGYRMGL